MGIGGRHSANVATYLGKQQERGTRFGALGLPKYSNNRFKQSVYDTLLKNGDMDFEQCKRVTNITDLRMSVYEEVREAMILDGELETRAAIQKREEERKKAEKEAALNKPPAPPIPSVIPVQPLIEKKPPTKVELCMNEFKWMTHSELMELSYADYKKRFNPKEVAHIFYQARAERLKQLAANPTALPTNIAPPKVEDPTPETRVKRPYNRKKPLMSRAAATAAPSEGTVTLVGTSMRQLAEIPVGDLQPEQKRMVKAYSEKVIQALLKDKSVEIKVRMLEDPPVMEIIRLIPNN